jgi:hypothetical protein
MTRTPKIRRSTAVAAVLAVLATGACTTQPSAQGVDQPEIGPQIIVGEVSLGGPISNAVVTMTDEQGAAFPDSMTTGPSGAFMLEVPAGTGVVTITASGGVGPDGAIASVPLQARVDSSELRLVDVDVPSTIAVEWAATHSGTSPADASSKVAELLSLDVTDPLGFDIHWGGSFDDMAFVEAASDAGGFGEFVDTLIANDEPVNFPVAASNDPEAETAVFAGVLSPLARQAGGVLASEVFSVLTHRLFGKLFPDDDAVALAEINAKLDKLQVSIDSLSQGLEELTALTQKVSTQIAELPARKALNDVKVVWEAYELLEKVVEAIQAGSDPSANAGLRAKLNDFVTTYENFEIAGTIGTIGDGLFIGSGGVSIMSAYSTELIADGFLTRSESAQLLSIYVLYEAAQHQAAVMTGRYHAAKDELAGFGGTAQDSADIISNATKMWNDTIEAQRTELPQQVPPSTFIHVPTNTMWFWRMSASTVNAQQGAVDYFNTVGGAFPNGAFAPPSIDQIRQLIRGRGNQLGHDYLYDIGIHGFESNTGAPFWDPQYQHFPQHTLFTSQTGEFDAEGGCPAEYRWAVNLADGVEQRLPIGFENPAFLRNSAGQLVPGLSERAQEVWGAKFDGTPDANQAPGWYTFCTSRCPR